MNSELILNDDNSIYHLRLRKEHIAPTVLLVGDQNRVQRISQHFDHIEHTIANREFVTHTGMYKSKRITALSTGIGTDNIDIVLNELDAAVNFDLASRTPLPQRQVLNLIRIGTSGALHADIPVGSFVISEFSLGFEGLVYFYDEYTQNTIEQQLSEKINDHLQWDTRKAQPYVVEGSAALLETLSPNMIKGITATASGFYGPQGRKLYLHPQEKDMNERLAAFQFNGHRITNFEMESSALYGLGKMLGHRCCTCCAIIANRVLKEVSEDYKKVVDKLIVEVLERV